MLSIRSYEEFELPFETFNFPAGELGVRLKTDFYKYQYGDNLKRHVILARLQNAGETFLLALLKDALTRLVDRPTRLILPYCPNSRQDRVCVRGEPFSLKVFADYINHLNFESILTFDPHSDVLLGVFDNIKIITQLEIIQRYEKLCNRVYQKDVVMVSPDAGSIKKSSEIAKYFGMKDLIRADKLRELSTGKIKETIVYCDDFKGADVLICDDICDYGRTFVELAKVLKAKNCGKIILYITHAIFSGGEQILYSGGIDEIFCTNSYKTHYDDSINLMNLEKTFELSFWS